MYTWNFDADAEFWYNDTFNTIEECIEDAKECKREDCEVYEEYEECYIGKVVPYVPTVSWSDVLDSLNDQAYDQCGEIGGEWDFYDYHKKDELKELDEELTKVLHKWLKKYGYYPNMYSLDNIKKYEL